jgi:hypothetical protein
MDAKSEAYLGPYQTIKAGTYSYMTGKTNTTGIMIRLVNNRNKDFGFGQISPFMIKTVCKYRCGHVVRDFESEAKTRCNFPF